LQKRPRDGLSEKSKLRDSFAEKSKLRETENLEAWKLVGTHITAWGNTYHCDTEKKWGFRKGLAVVTFTQPFLVASLKTIIGFYQLDTPRIYARSEELGIFLIGIFCS